MGKSSCSSDTGAYCKARLRLPEALLPRLDRVLWRLAYRLQVLRLSADIEIVMKFMRDYQIVRQPMRLVDETVRKRTAPECRLAQIVFLDRQPGCRPGVTRVGKDEALERLRQGMAVFDSEVEARRKKAIEKICEVPAWRLSYSNHEEAVFQLEELICRTR